ncbi:MAG: ABC transporter permease [Trueperaceae bacterium]|nr:ABC transporter permease [Trueperaceae bacterium]
MSTRRTREFFARGAPTHAPSRAGIVAAIVRKDLTTFGRDRLWMILTPLALFMFIGIYWLMPPRVDETLVVGVHPPAMAAALKIAMGVAEGDPALTVVAFEDVEAMAAAVADADAVPEGVERPLVGISLPLDLLLRARLGQRATATVYVGTNLPEEVRSAMATAVREVAATAAGAPLPVDWTADDVIVLGTDRAGDQIAARERMRPLMAFVVLLTESLALASLVSVEVTQRTASALLASPARTVDVLLAKGLVGTLLAFSQGLILLLATRAFGPTWPVLLVAVLLGAMMMAGIGMLTGAAGHDFIGTLFYGMGFLLVLMVPAIGELFPGSAAAWVQVIPSYGLVEAMVGSSVYGLGFADLAMPLLAAAGWVVVVFMLGWWALGRKLVQT